MARKYTAWQKEGNLVTLVDDEENLKDLKKIFEGYEKERLLSEVNRMLVIDNYDSFTYNLVQGFQSLGAKVNVYRNNQIDLDWAKQIKPTHLVISPGPGRPIDAGVSMDLIKAFAGKIPILGVCLGHQCIVEALGGKITYAKKLMHGKTSIIEHDQATIFTNLDNPMVAGRYHSLAADITRLPKNLDISATTEDNEIMAVRHTTYPIEGVQFHPESILTPLGEKLMQNFLQLENEVNHE
jgi:anthranilate synthase/aminodeoxychorismate synthase-like glutamine amidotransferase